MRMAHDPLPDARAVPHASPPASGSRPVGAGAPVSGPPAGDSVAPRPPARMRIGAHGEAAVCEHLEAIGYRILARNYRCHYGEIDIVAADGDVLVFIEVKTRSPSKYGLPRDAV